MDLIQRQFLCCYPINKINWQEFPDLAWDAQYQLLSCTVLHPLNTARPVKRSYQYAFLKNFVKTLEDNNVEVHDTVYEKLGELCRDNNETLNFAFKHYWIPSRGDTVTLKESNTFISEGTTGLCSWQASLALSEWLLANSQLVVNKIVLELGAGTGLSGIVAAKCGTKHVRLTDGSGPVVKLLQENLEINFSGKQANIEAAHLQWEEDSTVDFHDDNIPEVILGADITYDSSVFPVLVEVLDKIFTVAGNSCIFYMAATIRNEETFAEFVERIGSKHFKINDEEYLRPSNNFLWDESTPIKIISVKR